MCVCGDGPFVSVPLLRTAGLDCGWTAGTVLLGPSPCLRQWINRGTDPKGPSLNFEWINRGTDPKGPSLNFNVSG